MPQIIAQVVAMPTSSRQRQALSVLVGRWVEVDPQSAMSAAQKTQNARLDNDLIGDVFSSIASSDPTNAANIAQEMPEGQRRDFALQSTIRAMAEEDPAKALALSQSMKGAVGRINVYSIFTQWANKDLDKATQQALQLTR